MAETIGHSLRSISTKILLILIALTFVAWGVGDMFQGRTGNVVASVGDEEITTSQFSETLRRYQQVTGITLSPEELKTSGIKTTVLNQLINNAIQFNYANQLNITVGNDIVSWLVAQNDQFYDENKEFDHNRFKQFLQNQGLSEKQFVATVKKDLASALITESIRMVPQSFAIHADVLGGYRFEQRTADIVKLEDSVITKIPAPVDTDLVQFYQENQELFKIPESRDVTYSIIDFISIREKIEVSDDEVRSVYDSTKDDFFKPEVRELDQYLFDSQEQAQLASNELKNNSFKGDVKPVDMGGVSKFELIPEVQEPVFAALEGSFSEPVESPLGWHVFNIKKIIPSYYQKFEDVKETIVRAVTDIKTNELYDQLLVDIEDDLAAGLTLEELATKYELKVQQVFEITERGQFVRPNEKADTLPNLSEFLPLVYGLEVGEESNLTLLSDSSTYFIARVDTIKPSRIRALDEVRGNAIELWKQYKKQQLFSSWVDEIAKQISDSTDLDKTYKKLKLKVDKNKVYTRAQRPEEDEEIRYKSAVFLPKITGSKHVVSTPIPFGLGKYSLAVVKGVKQPSASDIDKDLLDSQLSQAFIQDIRHQHSLYMNSKSGFDYEDDINNQLLDTIY